MQRVMNMKRNTWKIYALGIALPEAVGALAGLLTREGTRRYAETILKPPLSPPPIVFPIVWSVLYALMGVGAARVYLTPDSETRTQGLRLFLIQLFFNFVWSFLFFSFQAFGFAFVWLAILFALIVMMALTFYQADRSAGLLQIPYLLWVFFAGILNLGVWMLNK